MNASNPTLLQVGYKNIAISSTVMLLIWMVLGSGYAFLIHLATLAIFYIISYRLAKPNLSVGFCRMLWILQLLIHLLMPAIADSIHSYMLPDYYVKHTLANNINGFFTMLIVWPEFGGIFWGLLAGLLLHGYMQAKMRRKQDLVWQSFGFRVRDSWEYYDPFYPYVQLADSKQLTSIASEQPQLARAMRYSSLKRGLFFTIWLLLVVVMAILLQLMVIVAWA
jgi:hypothetical protein